MAYFWTWLSGGDRGNDAGRRRQPIRRPGRRLGWAERLEARNLLAADPLPVLMVLADQQDFYFKEYGDTRIGLEAEGLEVVVTARTTQPTYPHPGTGETGSGMVLPDVALSEVDAGDYSAIVFVGGWGASMYQYAFPGDYWDNRYDGDAATKAVVNELIGEFIEQDKFVTAICHGVMTLAWARVDGISPLAGKTVSVPWIGSPAVTYEGQPYGYFELLQYPQAVANGAIANTVSGQYGETDTVADDVVVDGRIITAENYDAALEFGHVVGQQVKAAAAAEPPPALNQPPIVAAGLFELTENAPSGTVVGMVSASDADAGQSLTFAIVGGNAGGVFSIDPTTGQVTVANGAAIDFESTPIFELVIEATDDGVPALSTAAVVTVELVDVAEAPPPGARLVGDDLLVDGTPGSDTIYVWTDGMGRAFAWMNGQMWGPHALPAGGRVLVHGGEGNDRIYATDAHIAVRIYGDGGHDQITGGYANDVIDGGDGLDRIWGMQGDDLIRGGAGNDCLDGREGNDIVLGEGGDDCVAGMDGIDLLVGGDGADWLSGGSGSNWIFDDGIDEEEDDEALYALLAAWIGSQGSA